MQDKWRVNLKSKRSQSWLAKNQIWYDKPTLPKIYCNKNIFGKYIFVRSKLLKHVMLS